MLGAGVTLRIFGFRSADVSEGMSDVVRFVWEEETNEGRRREELEVVVPSRVAIFFDGLVCSPLDAVDVPPFNPPACSVSPSSLPSSPLSVPSSMKLHSPSFSSAAATIVTCPLLFTVSTILLGSCSPVTPGRTEGQRLAGSGLARG
jgi:hypothetical protein